MAAKQNLKQIIVGSNEKNEVEEDDLSFSFELAGIQNSRFENKPSDSIKQQKSSNEENNQEPQIKKLRDLFKTPRIQLEGAASESQIKDITERTDRELIKKRAVSESNQVDTPKKVAFQKNDDKSGASFDDDSFVSQNTRKKNRTRRVKKKTEYFVQDAEQDPLRAREYDVTFKAKQFIEFFFYHVLFFILGPFSLIIIYPMAGKALTRNMGFMGLSRIFLMQMIQWAMIFTASFLWFFSGHKSTTYAELCMMFCSLFLRICTIASKYGSSHPVRLQLLRRKFLTYDELTQDYLLYKWAHQTDDVIEQELIAVIRRREIDTALFFFNFITTINEETKTRLTNPRTQAAELSNKLLARKFLRAKTIDKPKTENGSNLPKPQDQTPVNASYNNDDSMNVSRIIEPQVGKLQENSSKLKKERLNSTRKLNLLSVTLENLEAFQMISGVNLAREIIYESKTKGLKRTMLISIVAGLIVSMIPLFGRIGYHDHAFGETGADHFMCVLFMICNTYFFAMIIAFSFATLSDLMKKFYLMTQLSNLLSVKKVGDYLSEKIYPTMNIFDPLSLRAWINLRMIFMDYGRKYLLRMNPNITVFLGFYIIILLIIVLQVFEIMVIINDGILLAAFVTELIMVFSVLIKAVIVGASINDHFRVHKNIIQKNKTVTSDLLQLDDIYFPIDNNNFKAANILYQEGVAKIRFLVKLSGFEERSYEAGLIIQDYLTKLVTFNDNAIEEMEFEEENNPVRIMGFVANRIMVRQIFVALFSLGFAVLQKQLNL